MKVKASISVFFSCLLVFVIAVVFALLEVSRVWGLEQKTEIDVTMTGNSILAEYTSVLWEEYGLLFLDGSYGRKEFQIALAEQRGLEFSTENLDVHSHETGQITATTWNLYGLQPDMVEISNYGLATDQGGLAFQKQAVTAVGNQFTEEMLQTLYNMVADTQESELPEIEVSETDTEIVLSENPLDVVNSMKQGSVLGLIIGDENISEKQIDLSSDLFHRDIAEGNIVYQQETLTWQEKILFRQYLQQYFPSYVNMAGDHALDYELEYLIVGKDSDKENLRGVVNRLLVMREVANLQFLKTNVEKQEVLLAAATALGAMTMSPELIPVYKKSLMVAWAYAESVSDVRLLLEGEQVSLIKTNSQWRTDITSLGNVVGSNVAHEVTTADNKYPQGLTYQQYLQILLWTVGNDTLAYRGMELIEQNTGVNMNYQIYRLDGRIGYVGQPLFPSLIGIGYDIANPYHFSQAFSISYIQDSR